MSLSHLLQDSLSQRQAAFLHEAEQARLANQARPVTGPLHPLRLAFQRLLARLASARSDADAQPAMTSCICPC
jgi:hypothetical protein